ncbi:MAG: ABC transporter substrate-binding protein [Stappiaceae bacterium]
MSVRKLVLAALLGCATPFAALAEDKPEIELLHWWDGASARVVQKMKDKFEEEGGVWRDTTVAGEGASALTTLRARALAGNPPGAVQLKGPDIQEWGELGVLRGVDNVAAEENWNELLPPLLQTIMQHDGKYVAVPVTIHRIDWMYASPKALKAVGAEVPTNWDEFNATAEKMAAAGITPVALGGQKWQEITMFEAVAFGHGVEWYQKAFVELDEEALKAPEMISTLEQIRRMVGWTDSGMPGRDYEATAAMVVKGDAGFQFMGDWILGAFDKAGAEQGADYVCIPTPMSNGEKGFILNADSIAFFQVEPKQEIAGQELFAKIGMSKDFQHAFNQAKGSIPPRTDVSLEDFSDCQKQARTDLDAAVESGTMVKSMAHSMAVNNNIRAGIIDAVSEYINSDQTPEEGAEAIRLSVELTR